MHPPCKSVKSVSSVLCHLYSVLCYLYSKKTLHLCLRITGRKILVLSRLVPRMESAVNMNGQAHDNMSASHGRCENGKVNEKHKGQGAVCQNNILNINLMYSRNLAHLFSKTVRLSLKCQPSCSIEISLHCCPPPLTD